MPWVFYDRASVPQCTDPYNIAAAPGGRIAEQGLIILRMRGWVFHSVVHCTVSAPLARHAPPHGALLLVLSLVASLLHSALLQMLKLIPSVHTFPVHAGGADAGTVALPCIHSLASSGLLLQAWVAAYTSSWWLPPVALVLLASHTLLAPEVKPILPCLPALSCSAHTGAADAGAVTPGAAMHPEPTGPRGRCALPHCGCLLSPLSSFPSALSLLQN